MKLSTVLSIAPLLLGANGLPTQCPATDGSTGPFQVMSIRSGSPIQYLPMTASGESFYLAGTTTTYCPEQVGSCPDGTQTVLLNGHFLDVTVPGGQEVYIDPSGAVKFTIAHSASIPTGSFTDGFSYTPGEPIGHWNFNGGGATGFIACPTQLNGVSIYQVFANIPNAIVPSGNVADCLGFDAAAVAWTSPDNQTTAAWEYI